MSVDNVLLLRVGIDSGTGSGHGPLFGDNSFEYIPIPEDSETAENRTYDEISGRTGETLSQYVSHLRDETPHFDPEFTTYTYGDPSPNKRSQLRHLSSDDLLIFYSSLAPQDVDVGHRLAVIGYFTVEAVYDLQSMTPAERADVMEELPHNAHVKRDGLTPDTSHREYYPVIVKGRSNDSRLFEEPRPLGDSERAVLPWVADIIGFDGDLTRGGVARVLDTQNASEIKRWLAEGTEMLIDNQAVLRSYVVRHDTGFAPNVTGGYCTLATCKPRVRDHANVGDWVLGTPSRADGEETLTYLFRVDEKLTYDEYYHDERFEAKKPENDPKGDNIYYREDGVYVQDEATNHHTDADQRERDLGTDAVLIGESFWYFGGSQVPVPEELRHDVIHKYESEARRLYSKKEGTALGELVAWCSLRFDPGVRDAVDIGPGVTAPGDSGGC